MPTYLFWGNDQFQLSQAIQKLQDKVLDSHWITFNFNKLDCSGNQEAAIEGLNQVVTSPFGTGGRLIWLMNPPLSSQQAKDFISELQRTIPALNPHSHLLLTFDQKPNGRSKIFKFLEKHAITQEFSHIPLWKTGELLKLIQKSAKAINLSITPEICEYLVEALGNDTRAIQSGLEKLKLYHLGQADNQQFPILDLTTVKLLIPNAAQTSLDLAAAIKEGQTDLALELLENLLSQNEAPLKIIATLIRQFRTWMWIKVLSNHPLDNQQIAKAAEIHNPKRIYFLKKEIQSLSQKQIRASLFKLHDLELRLKQGAEAKIQMQSSLIQVSEIFQARQHF